MRYSLTENPYIWARFNTGDSPTISIYDASDDSIIINAAAMSELAATGHFKYLFDPSPVVLTNYFYIASTTDEEISGAFTLGGYPDEILADTNDLQTNQGNWLTATGFSVPNEYDTELASIQADLDNPDQYKAAGFATETKQDIADAKVDELHKLQGLDATAPMTVTPTSREAGAVTQTISGDGVSSSTVQRA